MKVTEIITEAPLTDYVPMHMDQGRRFNPVDRRLVTHPTTQAKATKFFERTPVNFRLFFNGSPGLQRYQETGEHSPEDIRRIFGEDAEQILNGHEDAITVVFVGNTGADKVMLTPWVMAHRIGHAIVATDRVGYTAPNVRTIWGQAEDYFFREINEILRQFYGERIEPRNSRGLPFSYNNRVEYNALFNAIGTQRSSREGRINRPYEFLYELFAQYIKDGRITLKPLPVAIDYGRRAWGRPTKAMRLHSEYRADESRQEISDDLAINLAAYFRQVLNAHEGKILIM